MMFGLCVMRSVLLLAAGATIFGSDSPLPVVLDGARNKPA